MSNKSEKSELGEDVKLLQKLIQNKCVNPPGNEMKSIKTIENFLKKKGIECEIFETAPNRGNLVAKIEGKDKNQPGLILGPSHVDVVPIAKPDQWDVDPFAAEIKEGSIWGRGALDMLFIVASQVCAFAKLFEEKFQPKGDVILFIVSDEECGGEYGAEWMVKNQPEKINIGKKKMYAVTEAGGMSIAPGKFVFINGEKGASWKILKFKGTPGHGSMPFASDNAVLKASKAATLLSVYCDKKIPLETKYLNNLAKGLGLNFLVRLLLTSKRLLPLAIKLLAKRDPQMVKFIHSLSRMTISPNIIKGGIKTNIIATEAELYLDIRTLPDQKDDYVIKHIKKAIGKLSDEVEILTHTDAGIMSEGTESPSQSEFVNAMEKAIAKELPLTNMVPLIAMGATDGRFLREKNFDTYGFSLYDPELPLSHFISLAHGVNERISLKTVKLSTNVYYNLAKEFL